MKEILYRSHAVERMEQRNISAEEVENILKNPDGVIPQSMDKAIFYKEFSSRKDNFIAVVAVDMKIHFEIITVMINFEVKI
jgi:hypothetical protein